MPAEIVNSAFCADYFAVYLVPSSKKGQPPYEVTLAGGEGSAYCTCPGFAYRQNCRHIKYVWDHACLWNPQWHDGGPDDLHPVRYLNEDQHHGGACPKCGGPMVPVRIAV